MNKDRKYNQIGRHKTKVFIQDLDTVVRYHSTNIVRFDAERIILDSGGWDTATTKKRMNQASLQFGLDYVVSQENGLWFVFHKGERKLLVRLMTLTR